MRFFQQLSPTVQGYIFTVITMLIWGSFSLLSRLSAKWNIQVWDILALRFGLAALILLPILIYKKDYRFLFDYRAVILACVGSIGYCVFVYSGFFYAPVVHGVVLLNGLFPVFTAILSYLFLKQPFDLNSKLSIAIISLTVLLMGGLMLQTGQHFNQGAIFFIGSAMCWAVFSILLKRWTFTAWQAMVSLAVWSAVLYLPFYVIFVKSQFSTVAWQHLAVQGVFHSVIVVIIATLSYAKAVEKIGVLKAGTIANIAPFAAAVLAVPLLNEPLNMVMLCGLIGMAVGALQPWRWLKWRN